MDTISFDDFVKVELRVGLVTKAERLPKSKKLLKLEVSFGELGNRVILAGVGQHIEPDALLNQKVVAVLNLAPREMMGVMSHGMLLAAHSSDTLSMVTCQADPGSQVG